MKSIVIIMVLSLSGCMYQSVNENDWRLGSEFCKSNKSEILSIEADVFGAEKYICKNSENLYNRK